MGDFSINIIDETKHIAILSGSNDDPDQWYQSGDCWINRNIPSISVNILGDITKSSHEYIIDNTDKLNICINTDDKTTGVVKISEFIKNINEYDDIDIELKNSDITRARMRLYDKDVIFTVIRIIGYRNYKYKLTIMIIH